MTQAKPKSEQNLIPLAITSLLTIALTSVAVVVSANTHINTSTSTKWYDADAAHNEYQHQLNADQLKQNALAVLRGLPAYNASTHAQSTFEMSAQQSSQAPVNADATAVNVNTFLLSQRMSNTSRLAELQMQPFFIEFDSRLFAKSSATNAKDSTEPLTTGYAGVGFPHIETNNRVDSQRYKPYKQLVSFSSTANGVIVPNVRCMGLSPEKVANRAKKYDAKIFELAVQNRVSASLVKAVVAKESCFNAKARSPVGAIGLMQLMPKTAQWLNVQKPENANQNLAAGVRYLAQLRKRFGSNELALAAYNAGPGNVERYNGIPPFAETQNYVQDVLHFYRGYVATTRFVNALNNYE